METTSYVLLLVLVVVGTTGVGGQSQTWCVARSNLSEGQLQTALDYACGAGADCAPIQPSGLCYLPNSVQSHASYAFNSYYQQRSRAPGSCDFSGSATTAMTDPSYGSCVYPSSSSPAGGGSNTPPGTGGGSNTPPSTGGGSNTPPNTPPGTGGGSNTPPGVPAPPTSGNVPLWQVPPPPGIIGITPGLSPFGPDGSESPVALSPHTIFYCLFISYALLLV